METAMFARFLGWQSLVFLLCALVVAYCAYTAWIKPDFRRSSLLGKLAGGFAGAALCFLLLSAGLRLNFKDFMDVLSGLMTMIAAIAGVGYFVFRMVYQKMFQQLSASLHVTRLEKSDRVAVTCEIRNEADVRINLTSLSYTLEVLENESFRVLPSEQNFEPNLTTTVVSVRNSDDLFQRRDSAESTNTTSESPAKNSKGSRGLSDATGVKTPDSAIKTWSLDAKSTTRFAVMAKVPEGRQIVRLRVVFVPDRTADEYSCVDYFTIDKDCTTR